MLATVAHDHLKGLAALTNETSHLAVREGRSALFVDHATSTHVIAVSGQTANMSRSIAARTEKPCSPISRRKT